MRSKVLHERTGTELAFLEKSLARLDEGFGLEKEEALKGGLAEMSVFRERCRTHYQVRVREIRARARQLTSSARRAEALTTEAEELSIRIEHLCIDALARYEGTPNRLVRVIKSTMKEER